MTNSVDKTNPVAAFRFELRIDGLVAGWFSECGGLTIKRKVEDVLEGGVNHYSHRLPGRVTHQNLTLKRGLAGESLWRWFESGQYNGQVKRRHATVLIYNPDRTVARQWELVNCYPIKWSCVTLKAEAKEMAVETLELAQDTGGLDGPAIQTAWAAIQRRIERSASVAEPRAASIDRQQLARQVYALLKQELIIERERSSAW
ncbi:MAG: phage tail protein [Anaerolineae bacterium]|nr:phage tail protein [Anaerolineae bacterium]MCB9107675.1 phage tail protein [Anaerolineales bacterium]